MVTGNGGSFGLVNEDLLQNILARLRLVGSLPLLVSANHGALSAIESLLVQSSLLLFLSIVHFPMVQRLLAALAAISITVAALFGDSVDCFDGGGKSEPQPTLYDELILPAGYPYAEYMIFSEKRGQWKAAIQSREYIRSFQRYYSNTYLDGNKHKAINLFLGHFQPQQGKPALWELDSDHCCTVGKHDPSSVDSNVRSTIRRSLSDGSILYETDTTIRSMEHINCQHSGKSDQHCLLEVSPDIRICGSDVCHCRLISFCPQNSNLL